jgi:hypothetical protein
MNKLQKTRAEWVKHGFRTDVVNAPKDAISFDKILVIFAGKGIREVFFYNTKEDEIVGRY